jgi:hypothetical protein
MTKEIRCKCKLCGARHRQSFVIQFDDKIVCFDCFCEYMKIFRGYKNREARKKPSLRLPEDVQKRYNDMLLGTEFKFNPLKRIDDGISEDS